MEEKRVIINALSEYELQVITAVMYAGRDNRPPFGLSLNEVISIHSNAEENKHSLMGKAIAAVCENLEKGIEMYT